MVTPSPLNEYWNYEDLEANLSFAPQPSKHLARSICSKQGKDLWEVITITYKGEVIKSYKNSRDIGYDITDKSTNRILV